MGSKTWPTFIVNIFCQNMTHSYSKIKQIWPIFIVKSDNMDHTYSSLNMWAILIVVDKNKDPFLYWCLNSMFSCFRLSNAFIGLHRTNHIASKVLFCGYLFIPSAWVWWWENTRFCINKGYCPGRNRPIVIVRLQIDP